MLIYRIVLTCLAPLLIFALALRVLRRRESSRDFFERLGIANAPRPADIWVHAASNGELTSARPVLLGLLDSDPNLRLYVTCNSTTGKNLVSTWAHPRITVRLAPLDFGWAYRRLIKRLGLQAYFLIEADFWPARLRAFDRAGVACALIGGRMSERSFSGWQRFPALARDTFRSFAMISPQDRASAQRFTKLGAQCVGEVFSLKALIPQTRPALRHEERIGHWLAASTHKGEDETLLRAHALAAKQLPDLRMILAPRHPARGAEIAELASSLGLNAARRSEGVDLNANFDVLIADTLGEMQEWYAASYACFVAGSLVEKGGHTPFEPAAQNCALLHGPHIENFAEVYAALDAGKGALCLSAAQDIADALVSLRAPSAAQARRDAAHAVLEQAPQIDDLLAALRRLVNPTQT